MPHWSLPRSTIGTRLMVRLAEEYGVSLASCLAGSGLEPGDIGDSSGELAGQQELAVLRNILRCVDPAIPFALMAGLRYQVTTHGMWGFAVMSSPNFGRAIEVGVRYFDLSHSFNRLRLEVDEREARLLYDGSDNPDDLQAALIERDLGALVTIERTLLGRMVPPWSVKLRGRRPPYAHAFAPLLCVEPQFEAERNCVCFDPDLLALPQPLADDFGLRVSEEQCRLLRERRGERSGVAGRVRMQVFRTPGEFPGMKTVATRLGLSTRTLHNQLAKEGTSYRDLVEEIRETLAEELLTASYLTVDEIAQRLGYADTSSFIAAFKRWRGVPPGSYKRTSIGRGDRKPE